MSTNSAIENPIELDDHKQRMDRMYRVQRHFYDVTRAYYLLGRNERIATLNLPKSGTVLEIGCGTGRNLIAIARRYPDAQVYGFDISDEMLLSATNVVAREGLHHRVHLAQGDATDFNGAAFRKPRYDRVLFSYTLSMIPEWQRALQNAAGLLSPGGELHVVDFGTCAGLPSFAKSTLYAWLNRFDVTPRTTLFEVAEQLAKDGKISLQKQQSHRGYAQHIVLRKSS